MAAESGVGTQAVERAMSLLVCFSDEHSELRISELCSSTGLGQSTVSRMIASLDRLGFVVQDPRTGLYRLGPASITLGAVALNATPLFTAARQVAQNLAHETGLGVNLAEPRGFQLFYLANFEGPGAPKSFTMAGRSAPLHATGMGKAILAGQSADFVAEYYARDLGAAYTPYTLTRPDDMHAALAKVDQRGYATEDEELAFGRACVAAPIRDRSGDTVGAMSVSGPLSTIDLAGRQAELGRAIVEAADEVSVALGYTSVRAPSAARSAAGAGH